LHFQTIFFCNFGRTGTFEKQRGVEKAAPEGKCLFFRKLLIVKHRRLLPISSHVCFPFSLSPKCAQFVNIHTQQTHNSNTWPSTISSRPEGRSAPSARGAGPTSSSGTSQRDGGASCARTRVAALPSPGGRTKNDMHLGFSFGARHSHRTKNTKNGVYNRRSSIIPSPFP